MPNKRVNLPARPVTGLASASPARSLRRLRAALDGLGNVRAVSFCILIGLAASATVAGIRGPGEYAGTVVVDRWGGMYLYSGVYLMPISQSAKESLVEHRNHAVVIDALEVFQPINPGDGLIRRWTLLGRSPDEDEWVPVAGLQIRAVADFSAKKPAFDLCLTNAGNTASRFMAHALGMTILARKDSECSRWEPADGPSFALLTRQSFWGFDGLVTDGRGSDCGHRYSWTLESGGLHKPLLMIEPGRSITWRVRLELSPGEYELLVGYGGGVHESLGIVSNHVSFDVGKDGHAVLVQSTHSGGLAVQQQHEPAGPP